MSNIAVDTGVSRRTVLDTRIRDFVLDNIIWFILIGMCIFAYFLNPVFLTKRNILNLLVHFSVLGVLTIAESLCLLTGHFDLSIESTVGFTAVIAGWLMLDQRNASGWMVDPFLAVLAMLAVGTVIGLINGLIIIKVGLNPFIVTLAMLIILRGTALGITEGMVLYNLPKSFTFLGSKSIAGLPIPVLVLLVSFIIAHIVISRRPFGRELYAIGGNRYAARASGIDDNRRIISVFVLSSVLAAFAGWMLAGRIQSVTTNLGEGMVFDVFAAAVIGGVSLNGGRGTMIGALGGVLLLGVISNSLTLAQVSSFWIDATRGLLILIAMFIDAIKLRFR